MPINPSCYQPYYCEENIWHLCREPRFSASASYVIVIANSAGSVLFCGQKAGVGPHMALLWDYHVVLAHHDDSTGWTLWDLDSCLGLPVNALDYLSRTFPADDNLPAEVRPMFRVMPGPTYLSTFSSHRTHMVGKGGEFIKPPPPWKILTIEGQADNLDRFVDMSRPFVGNVFGMEEMGNFFARAPLQNDTG